MRIFGCALRPQLGGEDGRSKQFALATETGSVEVWEDSHSKEFPTLLARAESAHVPYEALRVAWNNDGTSLLSGGGNGILNMYKYVDNLELQSTISLPVENDEDMAIYACWFTRYDPKRIVTGYENKLALYDLDSRQEVGRLDFGANPSLIGPKSPLGTRLVFDACESPTSSLVAVALSDGALVLTDPREPSKRARSYQVHDRSCTCCRFSSSGRYIVTASADGTAIVWDERDPAKPVYDAIQHGGNRVVYSACFAPNDDNLVATLTGDTAYVWKEGKFLLKNQLDFPVLCFDCDKDTVIVCGEGESSFSAHGHSHTQSGSHSHSESHSHSHAHTHSHSHSQSHNHSHSHSHGLGDLERNGEVVSCEVQESPEPKGDVSDADYAIFTVSSPKFWT